MERVEKDFFKLEAAKKNILRGLLIFWLTATVFLFLRILLAALGADPQSFFASLIYFISGIFLLPYSGIFPYYNDTLVAGRSSFDAPATVAIFCYTVLTLFAVGIDLIVTKMMKTEEQVDEVVEKDHLVDPTLSEQLIK